MSTPPFVALPKGVAAITFDGPYGPIAGWLAEPDETVRGSALLVPGFTGSKEDFIAVLPELRELGWAVATLDMPGQFESPGPDLIDAYSQAALAQVIGSVANQVSDRTKHKPHLLGHSYGGLIARDAYLANPQDVFASVTLLCSGPAKFTDDGHVSPLQHMDGLLPDTAMDAVWQLKEAYDRAQGWATPAPDVYEFVQRRFVSNNAFAMKAAIATMLNDPGRLDELADALNQNQTRCLVAYGAYDDAWEPAVQRDMAEAIGAAQLVLDHTGHSPNVERPVSLATTLEGFWSTASSISAKSPARTDTSVESGYNKGMEFRSPIKADPAAVRDARRAIGNTLTAWNMDYLADDLEIIASEMVTNAVRYGQPPIEFRLIANDDNIRFEVYDSASDVLPAPRDATADEFGGRGLALIEALATTWGYEKTPEGKVVWAQLSTAKPE